MVDIDVTAVGCLASSILKPWMVGDAGSSAHASGMPPLVPNMLLAWNSTVLDGDQYGDVVTGDWTFYHRTNAGHSNYMAAEKHYSNRVSATYHFGTAIWRMAPVPEYDVPLPWWLTCNSPVEG